MPEAAATKTWPALTLAQAHAAMTRPGSTFEMDEAVVRGVKLRVWKNAPRTMREAFLAGRAHGNATYIVFEDERATFENFSRAAVKLAHEFIAEGVQKGDRVAVAMRNLPEWPVAYFAALLVGAIGTPLNAWGTGNELEYGLVDSGAKVAVLDGERWSRLEERLDHCRALRRVFLTRKEVTPGMHPAVRSLQDVIGATNSWGDLPALPLPDVPLEPDDDATLFYTSGTTGPQKGALGTHRSSTTVLMASNFVGMRNFVRRGEPIPDPASRTQQRGSLVSIPFFHTTGCQALLCVTFFNGTKIVTMHKWDPEQAMQLIERERLTQAGGVPTIAWQLVEHPSRTKYDLSSLETVSYGGAPASAELVKRIKAEFPKSIAGTGWGMTETSATFTSHSAEDYENRPDSAGPALPINEIKICNDDGVELPRGQVGELWARGPNIVKGYWNRPEETARAFVDGWVKTGDLARMDDEGFLFIVDRKKDMLIRGGENIYCSEVEGVLYEHPAVMDAGVVGIPHRTLGEEPGAVVALKEGADASEDELKAFVRERLAAFKVPVRILILRETLPRNPSGKILKPELKRLLGIPA
jgi:long-chain acyl-CoA synthetase